MSQFGIGAIVCWMAMLHYDTVTARRRHWSRLPRIQSVDTRVKTARALATTAATALRQSYTFAIAASLYTAEHYAINGLASRYGG